METSSNQRVAGDFVAVEVGRRWRVRGGWQVQITRRDNGHMVQRLPCATYETAELLARRVEKDLAVSLDEFCHTYLIRRAALR